MEQAAGIDFLPQRVLNGRSARMPGRRVEGGSHVGLVALDRPAHAGRRHRARGGIPRHLLGRAIRDPAAPADPTRLEWYCFACSFRPWADTGRPDRAWLTVVRTDGTQERLRAQLRGDRFIVSRPLRRGERAYVAAGDLTDAFGNVNGQRSSDLKGRG